MTVDLMLFAAFGLGGAAVCVAAGIAIGGTRKGAETFPVMHVSFDPELSDEERLRFLDRAADAVRSGRLSQAQQLKDESSSD